MKVQEMDVREARELHLDSLSTLTMTYTDNGFQELVQDIGKNGQLVPILLRDGKILDGRHRHQACMELGISVLYREVGTVSDDEALDIVISNSINKATGTDASKVEAYLMCKAKGMKQKDMPSMFRRLNANYIHKLVYIEKENPEYLQVLLRQHKVSLHNKKFNRLEDCGTINGIWRILKDNNSMNSVVEVADTTPDVNYDIYIDEFLGSPAAVREYWEWYDTAKLEGINIPISSNTNKAYMAMLKNKYGVVNEVI